MATVTHDSTPRGHPRARLDYAESIDGYLAAVSASPLNREARSTCRYSPFFAGPDKAERLLKIVDNIPLLDGADIIVMHPTADNGYPHTRPGNIVCLPTTYLDHDVAALRETLVHEAIHLHQRANPHPWYRACLLEGWTPVSLEQIPAELRERCRINPDTFSPRPFWSWDIFHVPLPLFTPKPSSRQLTLSDCVVKWLDLRNGALVTEPPSTFKGRYGAQPPQPEHPFELLAVEAAAPAENIRNAADLERKLGLK